MKTKLKLNDKEIQQYRERINKALLRFENKTTLHVPSNRHPKIKNLALECGIPDYLMREYGLITPEIEKKIQEVTLIQKKKQTIQHLKKLLQTIDQDDPQKYKTEFRYHCNHYANRTKYFLNVLASHALPHDELNEVFTLFKQKLENLNANLAQHGATRHYKKLEFDQNDIASMRNKVGETIERLRVDDSISFNAFGHATLGLISELSNIPQRYIRKYNLLTPSMINELDRLSTDRQKKMVIDELQAHGEAMKAAPKDVTLNRKSYRLKAKAENIVKRLIQHNLPYEDLSAALEVYHRLCLNPFTTTTEQGNPPKLKRFARSKSLIKHLKQHIADEGMLLDYVASLHGSIVSALETMRADTSVRRSTQWKPTIEEISQVSGIDSKLFHSVELMYSKKLFTPDIEFLMNIVGVERKARYLIEKASLFHQQAKSESNLQSYKNRRYHLINSLESLKHEMLALNLPSEQVDSLLSRFNSPVQAKIAATETIKKTNRRSTINVHESNHQRLTDAIRRMAHGKNFHTPLNSRITLQNVCEEAQIDVHTIYRNNAIYSDILELCRNEEMLRKKSLLDKALSYIIKNMNQYANKEGFRLSMNELMLIAGITKDQYKAITIPMDDLLERLSFTQEQFRKLRSKTARVRKST